MTSSKFELLSGTKVTLPEVDGNGSMFELQMMSDLRHYPETPHLRVERFELEKKEYECLNTVLQQLRRICGQEISKPQAFNPVEHGNQLEVKPDLLVLFESEPDPNDLTSWLRNQCTQFKSKTSGDLIAGFTALQASAVIGEITQSGGAHLATKLFQLEKTLVGVREGRVAKNLDANVPCLACVFLNSTTTDFDIAKLKLTSIMNGLQNIQCRIRELYDQNRLLLFYTPYRNVYAVLDNLKQDMDQKFKDMDQKFNHIDQKFNHIDQKFNHMDQKFNHMDQKFNIIIIGFVVLAIILLPR